MGFGPFGSTLAKPEDQLEIDSLLRLAFGKSDEAELVRRLRADGDLVREGVLTRSDYPGGPRYIVGYNAISRMVAPANWFCLAPLAVLPEWQNGAKGPDGPSRGGFRVGTQMAEGVTLLFDNERTARKLLDEAGLLNGPETPTLVVLGKPSFYARAGFSLERASRLTSPYPISHTLIARAGDDVPERQLIYPPAFGGP